MNAEWIKLRLIIFTALLIVGVFSFTKEVSATTYESTGNSTSTNLLSAEARTVDSIDSFYYNASALPAGTGLKFQFSQDNTNWYSATGTPSSWSSATTTGGSSWDLSGLGWSGANFYYKTQFDANASNDATPVLDDIKVNYTVSGNYLVIDDSGYVGIGTTSPDVLFQVEGITEQLRLGYDWDSYTGFTVGSDSTLTIAPQNYATTTIDGAFRVRHDGSTNSLVIDKNTGHVGIGTTTPYSLLTLKGTGSLLELTDTSSTTIFKVTDTGSTTIGSTIISPNASSWGNVLVSDGSNAYWQATSTLGIEGAGGVSSLDDLSDVAISGSTYGEILMYTGANYVDSATSALKIFTEDLVETTNLFWTDARFDTRLSGSSTFEFLLSAPSLATIGTIATGTWQGTAIDDVYLNMGSLGALADVSTSSISTKDVLYYTGSGWDTTATSSWASQAGTVSSGTQGQVAYYANAGTTLTGTSTLFLTTDERVGIGTTTPDTGSLLTVEATSTTATPLTIRGYSGQTANLLQLKNAAGTNLFSIGAGGNLFAYGVAATSTIPDNTNYAWTIATGTAAVPILEIDTTGTKATTSITGGFSVDSGALEYDYSSGITSIDSIQLGSLSFDTDAGVVSWIDMPVATTTAGLIMSYRAQLDGNPMLTVYGETDGSGGIKNTGVGIGTTSPWGVLAVDASSTEPALTIKQVDSGNQGPLAVFYDGTSLKFKIDDTGSTTIGSTIISPNASSWGNVLVSDGSNAYWQATSTLGIEGAGGASSLDDLSDVAITGSTYGEILMYTGANYVDSATSALKIFTEDLVETTNLFWTDARFDTRLSGSSTFEFLLSAPSLATIGTIATGVWHGTAIDDAYLNMGSLGALADVSTSSISTKDVLYYTGSGWDTTATSSWASQAGTVSSGTQGQVAYYANAGTTLTGTSTLFLSTGEKVGIGTVTPAYLLDIYDADTNDYIARIHNASTTAPSGGGLNIQVDGYGNILNLRATSSDIVTISAAQSIFYNPVLFGSAGDVSMAYDLYFTNDTAGYINFNGPGYVRTDSASKNLDLTLLAANAGDVVVGDTFLVTGTSTIADTLYINAHTDRVGIGTSSPLTRLSVQGTAGEPVIDFASSTGASLFYIAANGNIGVNATSTDTYTMTINGSLYADDVYTASSSFYMAGKKVLSIDDGIRLHNGGDFYAGLKASSSLGTNLTWSLPIADGSPNQVLTTGGSSNLFWSTPSGSGTVNTGIQGQIAYYKTGTDAVHGTSTIHLTTDERVGIGTTTPSAMLTVRGIGTSGALAFNVIDSASTSLFTVLDSGKVGIGTSVPMTAFAVEGASTLATTTTQVWNEVIVVDGVHYAQNGTGTQQAINDLPDEGGKVFLPAGVYDVGKALTVPSNVWLEGAGASSTILYRTDDATSTIQNADITNGNSHIKISDLKIDGNDPGTCSNCDGIHLEYVTYAHIDHVFVWDADDYGIYLYESATSTISNNILESNSSGILLSVSDNNTITGNTANNNAAGGIQISFSNNNTITGNTCDSNSHDGISLSNVSNNNAVTGNTSNNNGWDGIEIHESSNNAITGNTVNNNSQHGIYFTSSIPPHFGFSSNNTITGNTVYDNGGSGNYDGIRIDDSDNNLISSNRIYDSEGGTHYAVHIDENMEDSVNNYIVGNEITGVWTKPINDAGTGTKYTQKERITLDTSTWGGGIPDFNILSINASSSDAILSVTASSSSNIIALTGSSTATHLLYKLEGSGPFMDIMDTSDISRFYIDNNGNIGIGTTTPYSLLTLKGTGSLLELTDTSSTTIFKVTDTGSTTIGSTIISPNASSWGNVLVSDGSNAYWQATSTLGIEGAGGASSLDDLSDVAIAGSTYGEILMYTGANYVDSATSALKIFTEDLVETSNKFWTDARFDTRLSGSSTFEFLDLAPNLTDVGTIADLVATKLTATDATSTSLDVTNLTFTTASGTDATTSSLYIGKTLGVDGSNQAAGKVLGVNSSGNLYWTATSSWGGGGGSGTVNTGIQGQIAYYKTGTDAVHGTSTIHLTTDERVGIGTTTPSAMLTVRGIGTSGALAFNVIDSASTSLFTVLDNGYVGIGTSTPQVALHIGTGSSTNINISSSATSSLFVTGDLEVGQSAYLGPMEFASSSGVISWIDMPVTGSAAAGTQESYTARIDGTNILTVYAESDGSGGVENYGVGINTTTPNALFTIATTSSSTMPVLTVRNNEGNVFRVDSGGDYYYDGTGYSTGADYAEYFYSKDTDLKSGEVVCVDITSNNAVKRCQHGADGNVMGIVSSNPAIVGNSNCDVGSDANTRINANDANREYANKNCVAVGLLGQVKALVSTENGPIRPGDSLTSASSTLGYAMRAGPGDPTVGVALEGFNNGRGMISVLISRRNKSLTVEMVEARITERIANMEIEDEVQLLITQAVEDLDFESQVQEIADEQIAQFGADLTVEFDAVSGELMTVAASVDELLTRMSMAEEQISDLRFQISDFGIGSTSAFRITEDGSIKLGDSAALSTSASTTLSTSTPDVAVVEIGADSDKVALIVNQVGEGDVADFQASGVSIVNIADTGKVSVVGELLVDGRIMVCSGGACGSALDEAVDQTMGDIGVEGKVVAGAFEGYCDEGFVWVPGSAKYGTLPGFCVMVGKAHTADIDADGYADLTLNNEDPVWVNVSQGEAQMACQSLGNEYHLISENEWLTIAENVIRVAENDCDKSQDGLQLATSTGSDANPLINANDANSEYASSSTSSIAYILSNDNVIYDLVSQVSEWTDQIVTKAGLPTFVNASLPAQTGETDGWHEYYEVEDYKGFNIAPPYYYNSSNGIGRVLVGDNDPSASSGQDNALRGFVRGAGGVFGLDLSHSPTTATSTIGFRCAR